MLLIFIRIEDILYLEDKAWKCARKKVESEEELKDMVLPVAKDVIGIVIKMLGYGRVMVKCQDDHERLCRIRGKMKRRAWIRLEDIVLVSPWDFQSDKRETSYSDTKETNSDG